MHLFSNPVIGNNPEFMPFRFTCCVLQAPYNTLSTARGPRFALLWSGHSLTLVSTFRSPRGKKQTKSCKAPTARLHVPCEYLQSSFMCPWSQYDLDIFLRREPCCACHSNNARLYAQRSYVWSLMSSSPDCDSFAGDWLSSSTMIRTPVTS